MGERKRDDIMPVSSLPFQIFDIESHWLALNEKRFDAEYYTKDVVAAKVILDKLHDKGVSVISVKDLSEEIFHRPRFKRKYVPANKGLPFLPPKEVFVFPLKIRKWIVDPPKGLTVEKDWLLITCSGYRWKMYYLYPHYNEVYFITRSNPCNPEKGF